MELFPTVTTHADYFCFISYKYPAVKRGQLWNFLKTRPVLTRIFFLNHQGKKRHFLLIIILRLCMKLSETGMEINQKIYLHSLLTPDILKVITVQVIAQRDSYRTLITCMKSQYMANVRDQNQTMTAFIPKNIRSQVLHLKNSLISESGYAYLIDRFR